MLPFRFLKEASVEVEEGVSFYLEKADYDPTPAERFEQALGHAVAEVREAPTRWPRVEDAPAARRCLLARPFQDWAVIYIVENAEVVIVAVAHGRRRPGYWQGRR